MSNRLIHSASPYLLQHAHNPVDWFPWGEEALQKAKEESKPILVSIGYSACHWCHVMEKESFENETTAGIMNRYFVNIKIDREERPDIDHIYMDALQAMTGSGGWPLNVFLTPQLKPFYGGTYFPPKAAHNRLSWNDTLIAVHKAFTERSTEIEEQAENLLEHLKNSNSFGKAVQSAEISYTESELNQIAQNLLQQGDEVWGGFGKAPKFPQSFSIQYLLRHYHFTKDEQALQQALISLDKMMMGGIYDHLGGGFARYSTDEKWLAPHFEKMLYDNALLTGVYAEAYQLTKNEKYKAVIEETTAFVERELMHPSFAFYTALDADSEGVEGKFYTWSKQKITDILGNADGELFCRVYNILEEGNWEHTNIIWLQQPIEDFAKENGLNVEELYSNLNNSKSLLFKERAKRIRPGLDDKTILSCNALTNIAFSKAFAATGNQHYRDLAIANMEFLFSNMVKPNGELFHCYKNGKGYINGFLDDYAYLIWALIHLQEITGNLQYLKDALKLMEYVIDYFGEEGTGFFFYTMHHQQDVVVQKKEVYDGATPSANAVLANCLNYLGTVFGNQNLCKRFQQIIHALYNAIVKYPTSFACWATAIQNSVMSYKEIVVTGIEANSAISSIAEQYMPNKILLTSSQKPTLEIPLFEGKTFGANTQFYLCKNQTCHPPKSGIKEFLLFCNI